MPNPTQLHDSTSTHPSQLSVELDEPFLRRVSSLIYYDDPLSEFAARLDLSIRPSTRYSGLFRRRGHRVFPDMAHLMTINNWIDDWKDTFGLENVTYHEDFVAVDPLLTNITLQQKVAADPAVCLVVVESIDEMYSVIHQHIYNNQHAELEPHRIVFTLDGDPESQISVCIDFLSTNFMTFFLQRTGLKVNRETDGQTRLFALLALLPLFDDTSAHQIRFKVINYLTEHRGEFANLDDDHLDQRLDLLRTTGYVDNLDLVPVIERIWSCQLSVLTPTNIVMSTAPVLGGPHLLIFSSDFVDFFPLTKDCHAAV